MRKNDIISVTIENISNDGSGITRHEGQVVFVPFTAAGDRAEVRIVSVKKDYAFGIIEKIIEPGPSRIEPDCALFGKCGGCAYRHISYEEELRIKRQNVIDALKRIGGIDTEVEATLPSPVTDGYRNKVQFPVSADGDPALYARRSHRTLPAADHCRLQPKRLNEIAKYACSLLKFTGVRPYDEETGTGLLRHIYLRTSSKGEVMLCFVLNGRKLPQEELTVQNILSRYPEITTILININTVKGNVITGTENRILFGSGYITDELAGISLDISALSFYQINKGSAENLYRIIGECVEPAETDTVLDLFCGTGSIGLSLADKVKRIVGVEVIPDAVSNAKKNAENNRITNADFICTTSEHGIAELYDDGLRPDVIITDPPRSGCEHQTIETIIKMCPKRVVMVSCNPATLARDVKLLCEGGYSIVRVVPVDMFPRTTHVETVILMIRAGL